MSALEAVLDVESGDIQPEEALAVTGYTSLFDLHEAAASELSDLECACSQTVADWLC